MALVYNSLKDEVSVQAQGAWFTFKPEQIKEMNDVKAAFIGEKKAYTGLIAIPEEFTDLEYRNSEAGKEALEKFRKDGITARCNHLRFIVDNEKLSLQGDLDRANIKADSRAYMSPAVVKAMEELARYKRADGEAEAAKVAYIKELEKELET